MAKKTSREKLNKLIKKREKLKKRKDEGKKTLLGNLRRKRIQNKINKNKSAQEDLAASKRKKKVNLDAEGNVKKTKTTNTKQTLNNKMRVRPDKTKKKKTKTDFFPM